MAILSDTLVEGNGCPLCEGDSKGTLCLARH